MKLVLFDFDGTLTKGDSFTGFLRFYAGNFNFITKAFLCLPILFAWFVKGLDTSTAKRKILNVFIKGEREKDLVLKSKEYIEVLFKEKYFREGVLEDLKKHVSDKNRCIIVSASLDIWIRPFADKMGIEFISTEAEFDEGKYTGNFKTKNCKGPEKARRILEKIKGEKYTEIIAYGNSKGDLEMMQLADVKNWI